MNRLEELRERFKKEPFAKAFGAELEKLEEGYAIVSFKVKESMVIVEGIANGGILATIGNSAGVYAAMSKIPTDHTRAIGLTIHFQRAAKKGEIVKGIARVIDESRTYLWVTFDIVDSKGSRKASGIIQYTKPITRTGSTPARVLLFCLPCSVPTLCRDYYWS